jgi:hypothetical protein
MEIPFQSAWGFGVVRVVRVRRGWDGFYGTDWMGSGIKIGIAIKMRIQIRALYWNGWIYADADFVAWEFGGVIS